MQRAVCLVSGGLDSCVAVAVANSKELELCFLHVNYGQRTQSRELRAFNDIAEHYGVERKLVVSVDYLKRIGGSALTDPDIELPERSLGQPGIPVSYVPFRNANFLSISTSWAEVLGARSIYIGAVEEDSSGYPDCRRGFFEAFNTVIASGTKPETSIEIETPLIDLSKGEIVRLGASLDAPFALTWSCYQNEEFACGVCDSCLLRLRGFELAEAHDPLEYADGQN